MKCGRKTIGYEVKIPRLEFYIKLMNIQINTAIFKFHGARTVMTMIPVPSRLSRHPISIC